MSRIKTGQGRGIVSRPTEMRVEQQCFHGFQVLLLEQP